MQNELQAIRHWLGQGSINIFGMPFAGKDTQGNLLASLLEAELLGGGAILRGSVIPAPTRKIMEAGGLIPTAEYLRIVLPYLSQPDFDGKPLLLSSVGRWAGEEQGVLQATAAAHHPLKAVVLLTVDEQTARQRHAMADHEHRGRRADDADHIFDTRLSEFYDKTRPVIDAYHRLGLLIEVDGTAPAVEVTDAVLRHLSTKIKSERS